MSKRVSSVLAGLGVALLGLAFVGPASACEAPDRSVSLPTTTAETGPAPMMPTPQGPEALRPSS